MKLYICCAVTTDFQVKRGFQYFFPSFSVEVYLGNKMSKATMRQSEKCCMIYGLTLSLLLSFISTVGAPFDDELWRIRQEVNNLKETLAMQSAYVQAMPGVGHMSTQADGSVAR